MSRTPDWLSSGSWGLGKGQPIEGRGAEGKAEHYHPHPRTLLRTLSSAHPNSLPQVLFVLERWPHQLHTPPIHPQGWARGCVGALGPQASVEGAGEVWLWRPI